MRSPGQRVAQAGDRLEDGARVDDRHLDVVSRAGHAAQVAERAAQEARADVDAEHERGLGDRLEEHRAVAGAVGIVHGLADEAGLEQ
jgi:hypothetical protein